MARTRRRMRSWRKKMDRRTDEAGFVNAYAQEQRHERCDCCGRIVCKGYCNQTREDQLNELIAEGNYEQLYHELVVPRNAKHK